MLNRVKFYPLSRHFTISLRPYVGYVAQIHFVLPLSKAFVIQIHFSALGKEQKSTVFHQSSGYVGIATTFAWVVLALIRRSKLLSLLNPGRAILSQLWHAKQRGFLTALFHLDLASYTHDAEQMTDTRSRFVSDQITVRFVTKKRSDSISSNANAETSKRPAKHNAPPPRPPFI